MGNCFTLHDPSRSLSSSSSFSSSFCFSSRSNSLCSTLSLNSRAAARPQAAVPPPKRILPFPTPRVLSSHYQVGQELGRGQFGVIRLCTCLASGMLFACKSVSKLRMHDLPEILREVRVMQRLSVALPREAHAILRLHQVIEDDSHVHLIMELCRGGELFERIIKKKCYSEPKAASIIKHLMQSIQLCHRMGIMHRDVKPENILFVEDSDASPIKLADFGLALEFSPGQKFSGMAGSAYYIAPEVLGGEYSEEVDVWSTGVVLYMLLGGVPPFWGETDQDIFDAIREGNLEFAGASWNLISFSAKDLIRRMLCADVNMRLTPAQVLEHPWILHHSKASEEGSQKHQHTLKSTDSSSARKADTEKYVRVLDPASASTAQLSRGTKQESSAQASSEITGFSTLDSVLSEHNYQNSTLCTISTSNDRNHAVPLLLKDEQSLMTLIAKLNDIRQLDVQESGWSCDVPSGNKTDKIFGLEIGKTRYLISNNNGKERCWRLLGQCHKSITPPLRVGRPAQPLVSS